MPKTTYSGILDDIRNGCFLPSQNKENKDFERVRCELIPKPMDTNKISIGQNKCKPAHAE